MTNENLLKLVKLFCTANLLLEQITEVKHLGVIKHSLKNKLNGLEKELERTIQPHVTKMYETDEDIAQLVEVSISDFIDQILEKITENEKPPTETGKG